MPFRFTDRDFEKYTARQRLTSESMGKGYSWDPEEREAQVRERYGIIDPAKVDHTPVPLPQPTTPAEPELRPEEPLEQPGGLSDEQLAAHTATIQTQEDPGFLKSVGRGALGAVAGEVDTIGWLANKIADGLGLPRQEVIDRLRDAIQPEDLFGDENSLMSTVGEALGFGLTQVGLLMAMFMKPLRLAKVMQAAKVRHVPQMFTKAGRAAVKAERLPAAVLRTAGEETVRVGKQVLPPGVIPVGRIGKALPPPATTRVGKAAEWLGDIGLVGPLGLGLAGGLHGAKHEERFAEEMGESQVLGAIKGGVTGFGTGAAMGGVFDKLNPLHMALRVPAMGTLFGGMSVVEGAGHKRALADFVTGSVLGVMGPFKGHKPIVVKGAAPGKSEATRSLTTDEILAQRGLSRNDPAVVSEAQRRGMTVDDYAAALNKVSARTIKVDDNVGAIIPDRESTWRDFQRYIDKKLPQYEKSPDAYKLAKEAAAHEMMNDVILRIDSITKQARGTYDSKQDPTLMAYVNNVLWEITREGAHYRKNPRTGTSEFVPGYGDGLIGQAYIVPSMVVEGKHAVPFLQDFMRANSKVQNTMDMFIEGEGIRTPLKLHPNFLHRLGNTEHGWAFRTATEELVDFRRVSRVTDPYGNEIIGQKVARPEDIMAREAVVKRSMEVIGEETAARGFAERPAGAPEARIPTPPVKEARPRDFPEPTIKKPIVDRVIELWPKAISETAKKTGTTEKQVKAAIIKAQKAKEVGVRPKEPKEPKKVSPKQQQLDKAAKEIVERKELTPIERLAARMDVEQGKQIARIAGEPVPEIPPDHTFVRALETRGFTTEQSQLLAKYDNMVQMLLDTHIIDKKPVNFTSADLQIAPDGKFIPKSTAIGKFIDRMLKKLKKDVGDLEWPTAEEIGVRILPDLTTATARARLAESVEAAKRFKFKGKSQRAETQKDITEYFRVVDIADMLAMGGAGPKYERRPVDRMSLANLSKRDRELFGISKLFDHILRNKSIRAPHGDRAAIRTQIKDIIDTHKKQNPKSSFDLTPSQIERATDFILMQNEARRISPVTGEPKERGRRARQKFTEQDFEDYHFKTSSEADYRKLAKHYEDLFREATKDPITSKREHDRVKKLSMEIVDLEQKLLQFGARMANLSKRRQLVGQLKAIETKIAKIRADEKIAPEQKERRIAKYERDREKLLTERLRPLQAEITIEPKTVVDPYEPRPATTGLTQVGSGKGRRLVPEPLPAEKIEGVRAGLQPGQHIRDYTGSPVPAPDLTHGRPLYTYQEPKLGQQIGMRRAAAEERAFKPLRPEEAKALSDLILTLDHLSKRLDQVKRVERIENLQRGERIEIGDVEVGIGTVPAIREFEIAAHKAAMSRAAEVRQIGPEGSTRGLEPLPHVAGVDTLVGTPTELLSVLSKIQKRIDQITRDKKLSKEAKERRINRWIKRGRELKESYGQVPLTAGPVVGEFTLGRAARRVGRLPEREVRMATEEKQRILEEDFRIAEDLAKVDREIYDPGLVREERLLRRMEHEGMTREEVIAARAPTEARLDPSVAAMGITSPELARRAMGEPELAMLRKLREKGEITDPEKQRRLDELIKEGEVREKAEREAIIDLGDLYPDGTPTRSRASGTEKEQYSRGTVHVEPDVEMVRGREVASPGRYIVTILQDTMTPQTRTSIQRKIAKLRYETKHNKSTDYNERVFIPREEAIEKYPWVLSPKTGVKEARRKTPILVEDKRRLVQTDVGQLEYPYREYEIGYELSKKMIDRFDLQRLSRLVKAAEIAEKEGHRVVAMRGILSAAERSLGPGKGKELVWDFEWRHPEVFSPNDPRITLLANASEFRVREYMKERAPRTGEGDRYRFVEHEGSPRFKGEPVTARTELSAKYEELTGRPFELGVTREGRSIPATKGHEGMELTMAQKARERLLSYTIAKDKKVKLTPAEETQFAALKKAYDKTAKARKGKVWDKVDKKDIEWEYEKLIGRKWQAKIDPKAIWIAGTAEKTIPFTKKQQAKEESLRRRITEVAAKPMTERLLREEARSRWYTTDPSTEPITRPPIPVDRPIDPRIAKISKDLIKTVGKIDELRLRQEKLDVTTKEGRIQKAELEKKISVLNNRRLRLEQDITTRERKVVPVKEITRPPLVGEVPAIIGEFDRRITKDLDKRLEKLAPNIRRSILELQRGVESGLREELDPSMRRRPPMPRPDMAAMTEIRGTVERVPRGFQIRTETGELLPEVYKTRSQATRAARKTRELVKVEVSRELTREELRMIKGPEAPKAEARLGTLREWENRLQAASDLLADKGVAVRHLDWARLTFNDLSRKIDQAADVATIDRYKRQLIDANLDTRAMMEKIQGRNYPDADLQMVDGVNTPVWVRDAAKLSRDYAGSIEKFKNTLFEQERSLSPVGKVVRSTSPELVREGERPFKDDMTFRPFAGPEGAYPGEYRFLRKPLEPGEAYKRQVLRREKEIAQFEKAFKEEQKAFERERKERIEVERETYKEQLDPGAYVTTKEAQARRQNAENSHRLSPQHRQELRGLTDREIDTLSKTMVEYQGSQAYADRDTLRRMAAGDPVSTAKQYLPWYAYLGQPTASPVPAVKLMSRANAAEKTSMWNQWNELVGEREPERFPNSPYNRMQRLFREAERTGIEKPQEAIMDHIIRERMPENAALREAVLFNKEVMEGFTGPANMRELGVYVETKLGFVPMMVDKNITFQKLKYRFQNEYTSYDKLPNFFHMTEGDFFRVQDIFKRRNNYHQTKEGVPRTSIIDRYERQVIDQNVFRWTSASLEAWETLPQGIKERLKLSKDTFNPHLQKRQPDVDWTAYKHDWNSVFKTYVYDMLRANYMDNVKRISKPLIDQYQDVGIGCIRRYMLDYLDKTFGKYDAVERSIASFTEMINEKAGRQLVSPHFAAKGLPGALTGQAAKGLLGSIDTAFKNLTDNFKSIVEDPKYGLTYVKSVNEYLRNWRKSGKGLGEYEKFAEILGMEREAFTMEFGPGRGLKERMATAPTLGKKAWEFYDWLGTTLLYPFAMTENFNKGTRFLMAINLAKERGMSFNEAVTVGLKTVHTAVPDLKIPKLIWDAHWEMLGSQIGYSEAHRPPYYRGALGRLSTIFWLYPTDYVRWMSMGLKEGYSKATKQHEYGHLARFAGMLGFQLSIASGAAYLGLNVSDMFGFGILPVKLMSLPWEVLYQTYTYADPLRAIGDGSYTYEERQKALQAIIKAGGILTVPQFRYGSKVVKTLTDLERGYKVTAKDDIPYEEVNTFSAILNMMGLPTVGGKESWDLMHQMNMDQSKYRHIKRDLRNDGVEALEKGDHKKIDSLIEKATKKGVNLSIADIYKAKGEREQLTLLRRRLKSIPKHLRPEYEAEIQRVEAKAFGGAVPSKATPRKGSRGMWSGGRSWSVVDQPYGTPYGAPYGAEEEE